MTKNAKQKFSVEWNALLPYFFVLWIVTLFVFLQVQYLGFVNWDDDQNFIQNPFVRGFGGHYWWWAWETRLMGVYQPISWLFLQAQFVLSPRNPAALIHWISLILHFLNSATVFLLFVFTSQSREATVRVAALVGAIYFAVHPLQCETIAWASCQPYLLAAFFAGLSLLCFTVALQFNQRNGWYWSACALFFLSILSKSIGITLPLLMALFRLERDRAVTQKGFASAIRRDWPFWGISFIGALLSLWARTPDPRHQQTLTLAQKAWIIPANIGFFFEKVVLPFRLSILYHPSVSTLLEPALGLVSVVALVWLFRASASFGKKSLRNFGWAMLALFVLLLSGIAASLSEGILFADRYAYLPNAIIAWMVADLVLRLYSERQTFVSPPIIVVFVFILGWASLTFRQLKTWSNPETLWTNALSAGAAMSPKPYINLSQLYLDQGRWKEARDVISHGLSVDQNSSDLYANLGMADWNLGKPKEAITDFEKSIQLSPDNAEAMNNLASAYESEGNPKQALEMLDKAIALKPDFWEGRQNRANLNDRLGNLSQSVEDLTLLVRLSPNAPHLHNQLGIDLARLNRNDEALEHFNRAVQLDPSDTGALFNRAATLRKLGRTEEARQDLLQALRINPNFQPALDQLNGRSPASSLH